MAETGNRFVRLEAGVDEFLGQGADDAVPAGKYLAESVGVLARRLDEAAGGCVDDRGYPARLRIKGVGLRHLFRSPVD